MGFYKLGVLEGGDVTVVEKWPPKSLIRRLLRFMYADSGRVRSFLDSVFAVEIIRFVLCDRLVVAFWKFLVSIFQLKPSQYYFPKIWPRFRTNRSTASS